MKKAGLPIALFAGAVVFGVLGQWPFAALCAVVAVAALAFAAMKGSAAPKGGGPDLREDLHPNDYARLAPLRKHRKEIEALVEAKKGDTSIAIIGAEALAEADHILQQAAKLVQMRRELLRASGGRTEAQRDLRELEQEIASATTDEERASLQAAQAARQAEVSHYEDANQTKDRVERGLRQAEAALAEMKARLATAAASASGTAHEDDLRDTVGRLKSLGTSLDEAEAWLKG